MKTAFELAELPLADLASLGLNGNPEEKLSGSDLMALLGGRRTAMMKFYGIKSGTASIDSLNAKLSLSREDSGRVVLKIHPIYKEPQYGRIPMEEAGLFFSQGIARRLIETELEDGSKVKSVVEYDSETKEFISYDPQKVQVPFMINGEELDSDQEHDFRLGKPVELHSGLEVMHSAIEPLGIISDTDKLLLRFDMDNPKDLLLEDIRQINPGKHPSVHFFSTGFESHMMEIREITEEKRAEFRALDEWHRMSSDGASGKITR